MQCLEKQSCWVRTTQLQKGRAGWGPGTGGGEVLIDLKSLRWGKRKNSPAGLPVTTACMLFGRERLGPPSHLGQKVMSVPAALQLGGHSYFPHKMPQSCLLPAIQGCNLLQFYICYFLLFYAFIVH